MKKCFLQSMWTRLMHIQRYRYRLSHAFLPGHPKKLLLAHAYAITLRHNDVCERKKYIILTGKYWSQPEWKRLRNWLPPLEPETSTLAPVTDIAAESAIEKVAVIPSLSLLHSLTLCEYRGHSRTYAMGKDPTSRCEQYGASGNFSCPESLICFHFFPLPPPIINFSPTPFPN